MNKTLKLMMTSLICMLLFTPFSLFAQRISVSGKVVDVGGQPLAGVGVIEKGTSNGVVTDGDGNYSISVSSSTATLSFSCMGFLPVDVPINGRSVINISLKEDSELLQEAVAIGYGTVKKVDLQVLSAL